MVNDFRNASQMDFYLENVQTEPTGTTADASKMKICIGFSITETMMNSKKGEYHDFFRIPEVLYLPQG